MKNKLKNFDKQLIVNDYNNGLTNKQLKAKYNISTQTVYDILDKFSVKRRNGRFYDFNESYFNNIDTADKAYFLGWLASDGNNYPESGHVQLKINEKDIHILHIFLKYISGNNVSKIRIQKRTDGGNQAVLKLSSVYMSKQLIKLGIVKAKSLILEFPTEEQVPKHLLSHFIRGYFDGDGCIGAYFRDSQLNFYFTISGRYEFLLKMQEIICFNCNLNKTKLIKSRSIFNMTYGGNRQVLRIREWLYKDCGDLFLTRKKEKFSLLLDKK